MERNAFPFPAGHPVRRQSDCGDILADEAALAVREDLEDCHGVTNFRLEASNARMSSERCPSNRSSPFVCSIPLFGSGPACVSL